MCRREVAGDDGGDVVDDRHLDAVRAGERLHGGAGQDALGDLAGGVAISATERPRPSSSPNVRFRDSGDWQVATRSPSPASPANVYGSAPSASPSRVVSARPRVISEAVAFAPRPSPTAMPTARAITFLVAPASSQPTTSALV